MESSSRLQKNVSVQWLKRTIAAPEFGPLVLLVVEIIVFTLMNPRFLSVTNISNLLAFTPELGMIALGMTLLMTAGEFDLSVGSTFGFAAVMMWTFLNSGFSSLEVGFVLAMLISVAIGFVNGWFVTRLRIPSFLVTMGMMLIVRGLALYITDGFPQRTWSAESPLVEILVGDFYIGDVRIYASLIWFILFAFILHYVLTSAKAGNWIQASGGNPMAAIARGVKVGRTKVWLFILSAVMSAFAGITSSIRVSAANPNSGDGYEMEVIAMVVIGGTALSGGRGTIIGTVLGVLILRLMRNGIVMVGVPGLAYKIFIGAIILGMMALHSTLERRNSNGS
jgi:simple sugar transport system permease protein